MSENRAMKALEEQVLNRDLCTLCGACTSLCPYLRPWRGRIVKMDDCDLEEGRCFSYCPRIGVDLNELHQSTFGEPYRDARVGNVREIVMARATDPSIRNRAQTGGVVTALVRYALDSGMVNAAVLTKNTEEQLPVGTVVRDPQEVLACAGSSYVACPTLEAFNAGPWEGNEKIALVGIPCQVTAIAKMRASTLEKRTPIEGIGIVIGLFCTWALTYRQFIEFLKERLNGAPILKLDITPPPDRLLKVTTPNQVVDVPIDDIRAFIRKTCSICPDMTSEFSDISVGTVEGVEGWNTVIIRSDTGARLFQGAKEAGLVETAPLPKENLDHLMDASILKKQRAINNIREMEGQQGGYLRIPDGIVELILSHKQEVES